MSKKARAGTRKVMVVMGTRPEGIKLAPLVLALQNDPRYELVTVSSGQHRDMILPVLQWFSIKPHHTLDVMAAGQPLAHLSGKLLHGLHDLMESEMPDLVMVQGDTTTAFMAALNAYYSYDFYIRNDKGARQKVEIAHVEAGLRTGDNYAPFPEEANRKLIGQLANWHFAPTATAAQSLFDEGVHKNVYTTGNTVIDALHWTVERLKKTPRALPAALQKALKRSQPMVLITGHRRESYGDGFEHICQAIQTLAKRYPDVVFYYPVHLNQHVQKPVNKLLGNIANVVLDAPLPYEDFVNVMQHAHLLLTDSGGLQEEGPALGKPVLVMREVTERPEGILAGTARLVGNTADKIVDNVSDLLDNPQTYQLMARAVNPYGDGKATERILNLLHGENANSNTFTPRRSS
ncbi:MAG TPA: UDP-N-acetylglucosamine 2-epimerase (non-hydrolyzing) [Alphaproteobacteria bacterium]|nr:UDP-N-acetylglucosamine 2-epimerase (non-hydrolyzing) [Alphaproteobacteria bacterium]